MNPAQVILDSLVIGYRGRPLLRSPLNLTIGSGEFWGIVGPNGAGKTTLIKTIVGILPPVRGRVTAEGSVFGYVPQRGAIDDIVPVSALDVVMMGRTPRHGVWRAGGRAERARAAAYLDRAGMSALAYRPFRALSGGQKQRVLIARALAAEPNVLIMDEPTDGMDLSGEASIMRLIGDLHRATGVTTIMITHQLNLVAAHADKVILLGGETGQCESGNVKDLLDPIRLQAVYGVNVNVHQFGGHRFVLAAEPAEPGSGS